MNELQTWIKDNLLIEGNPVSRRFNETWFKNNNHDEKLSEIIEYTKFLVSPSINQRIYHAYNNIDYIITCKKCENPVNYKGFTKGYRQYCSQKCVSIMKRDKFKEKYGVKSPLSLKFFKDKRNETCLKRYGNENYTNREQSKKTCLKRYGKDNVNKVESIKEKGNKTNSLKYGSNCPQSDKEVRKKTWNTLKNKYKIEDELDITNVFQIQDVKEKIKEVNLEKYGVEFTSQRYLKNLDDLNEEYIKNIFLEDDGSFRIWEFQKYFNISYSYSYVKLKEFGIKVENWLSHGELELRNFLKQFNHELIFNSKKIINPYEIDIYIPEINLGIEYNGMYWHCDVVRQDKNFHVNKTNMCEKKGIQLLHIFEHQWNDYFTREIIKSMIANKFNESNTIYGRKCEIKNVSTNEKNHFLNINHIQGQQQSNINFGLFYKDELVSLMTFGKPRFNKHHEWELLRFCNKKNTRVIGGASKLLKHFTKNYNGSIVTYADRTYSNGKLYDKLGFKKNKINEPSYFYFKANKIINRLQAQKNKLNDLLEYYDPLSTEYQNMINHGYNRIWTCGTIQYVLTN